MPCLRDGCNACMHCAGRRAAGACAPSRPAASATLMLHAVFLTAASPYFEARLRGGWYRPPGTHAATPCKQAPVSTLTASVARAVKAALPQQGTGKSRLAAMAPPLLPASAAAGVRVLVEHVEEEELPAGGVVPRVPRP